MIFASDNEKFDFMVWGLPINKIDFSNPTKFLIGNTTSSWGISSNLVKMSYRVALVIDDDCEILNEGEIPSALRLAKQSQALTLTNNTEKVILTATCPQVLVEKYPHLLELKHESIFARFCLKSGIDQLPDSWVMQLKHISFNNEIQKGYFDALDFKIPSMVIPYGVDDDNEFDDSIVITEKHTAIWIGVIRRSIQLQRIVEFAEINPECIVYVISGLIFDQALPPDEEGGFNKPYIQNYEDIILHKEFESIIKKWCKKNIPDNLKYLGSQKGRNSEFLSKSTMALCFSRDKDQQHDDSKILDALRYGCPVICDDGQPSHRFVHETKHGIVLPFDISGNDLREAFLKCKEISQINKKQQIAHYCKSRYSWNTLTQQIVSQFITAEENRPVIKINTNELVSIVKMKCKQKIKKILLKIWNKLEKTETPWGKTLVLTEVYRIVNLFGIRIKIKRKKYRDFKFNEKVIKKIFSKKNKSKKNFLYFDWHFGGYIFEEMLKEKYEKINLIKFSLFDIFNLKHRWALRQSFDDNKEKYAGVIIELIDQLKPNGLLVTFDWLPFYKEVIDFFKCKKIPVVMILHEGVFQDDKKYYYAVAPISDRALVWGDIHRRIFVERGYSEDKIGVVGSIKLNKYKSFKPLLSVKDYFNICKLDKNKKTILYCCQLLDEQWGDQEHSLSKQRDLIDDLVKITIEYDYNLVIRNSPASPKLVLPVSLSEKYRTYQNIYIDGEDTNNTEKSCYKIKAEDALFYSDLVIGFNTTMQLEASILNKPAIIAQYFDFDPKWQKEMGLPVATNYYELKELIVNNIECQHNLITQDKKTELFKNYGYNEDIDYSPLKNIERELLKFIWGEVLRTPNKEEFTSPFFGNEAIYKMLEDYSFNTVLDIGCGAGLHSNIFKERGKIVTSLDYGGSPYFLSSKERGNEIIIDDFMAHNFKNKKYDAVWCCHVLEHQLNPNLCLKKINSILKENGVLAITVPPLKHEIVGGHLSLWNAGLLLFNLVIAGFDCSKAIVKKYGYNISIILMKKEINILSKLIFDAGDIKTIKNYLPNSINFEQKRLDITFDGDIENIGWN